MSPYTAVEVAEIVLPLGVTATLAARSARRERARVERAGEASRAARVDPTPAPLGLLDRLHERRMRRSIARAGLTGPPRRMRVHR
jgi:hypothetical protein